MYTVGNQFCHKTAFKIYLSAINSALVCGWSMKSGNINIKANIGFNTETSLNISIVVDHSAFQGGAEWFWKNIYASIFIHTTIAESNLLTFGEQQKSVSHGKKSLHTQPPRKNS